MPHFSRLTDIVTCNLTELLQNSDDPKGTLAEVVHEMEEGLAGAERSVRTATNNETRLKNELAEAQRQAHVWDSEAREALKKNDENEARMALYRKKEISDLVAGLEQQVRVAHSTWENMMTTYRALEARLAEAQRKQVEMGITPDASSTKNLTSTAHKVRESEIEDELAELKRQLGS